MRYSEIELMKMFKVENLSLEDQITANILNFIRLIYLNKQNFTESSFDSEYYGELPMTFRKERGQVMGLIKATIHGEIRKYVFTDEGFESMEDLLKLIEG